MKEKPWNRCDACGRFIAIKSFDNGATRRLVTPDTAFTSEDYETLCAECTKRIRSQRKRDRAAAGMI